MSNSSKSEDEHTKDTVMDKEKEDSATLDERMSHTSSAKNEQKYRKDDSNSIERSREKNSPQHLRSKPSYKKVDPDEDEGEDKIVQMMDELEFDD
ncbi:hypothetical protein BY996DRAFT_6534535 [Phakopsora pachyrhizi]|nr:hypothetical protein BY996DRAFT_6534535 [Phakopsora pachyrhizi]